MKLKNNALQELYDTIANGTNEFFHNANMELASKKRRLEKDPDFYFNKYQELKKAYETVMEENIRLRNSIVGNEYIKTDIACNIGYLWDKPQIYQDPEIRQAECLIEMCADMTVVDYPERFLK